MLSLREQPMVLEECRPVKEEMDSKLHSIELMKFRFREGSETVGVKSLLR